MSKTAIEWVRGADGAAGQTWNPIVGCSIVSPGCTHCYAMRTAHRMQAIAAATPGAPAGHYAGTTRVVNGRPVWTGTVAQAPDATLLAPLRRKTPTTWFVNSMSDLFHEAIPDAWIDRVFSVMALSPQHTFQVLTKRSVRMRQWASDPATPERIAGVLIDMAARGEIKGAAALRPLGQRLLEDDPSFVRWPLPNVWLGVSAEDQRRADERIPDLLATPAAVRFVSCEPLLGPVDLRNHRVCDQCGQTPAKLYAGDPFADPDYIWDDWKCPLHYYPDDGCDGKLQHKLDWVIVGGESGSGARPMHPDWARSLRDQCAAAEVAFFFKQWGEWFPAPEIIDAGGSSFHQFQDGVWCQRVGKARAGRLLDGRTHDAMPGARP